MATGQNEGEQRRPPVPAYRILLGALVGLMLAVLALLGMFQPFEQLAYQVLFQVRGPRAWDDRLALVVIDDASLRALGRYPLPRNHFTRLVETLDRAEAAVIALNVLFSEPTADDAGLATAIARHGRVVLAQTWNDTGTPVLPVAPLRSVASATAHVRSREDFDGVMRTLEPRVVGVPALALAAVQLYSMVHEPIDLVDVSNPLQIDWPGPSAQAPQYSFVDVINGRVGKERLRDRIVVVGVSAPGFDALHTPFDQAHRGSIYLHGAAIDNLLRKRPLQHPDPLWLAAALVGVGALLATVLGSLSGHSRLLLSLGLALGWSALAVAALHLNVWLPTGAPLALVLGTAVGAAVEERLRLNQLLADKIAELTRLLNAGHPQHKNRTTTEQQILQLSALAERLSRAQAAQAAIAEGVSIGLAAADLDGRVWFCNPTLRVQSGLQTGDDLDSRLVPDWLSSVQWHEGLECLRRGQPTPVWQVAREERWFALHGEPLCYLSADVWATEGVAGARTTGLLLVVEDVTTARQQVQELQQLNQLKDEFVSTVSHELRTPMANIKMAVHLLRSSRSDQQRRQYLTILQQECAREIELINNLLDLQRLEANRTTFSPSAIAPMEWLQEVIQPFRQRCEAREQYLKVVIPDALPTLVTDSAALERIVAELLNNACKYTPPDHIIELFARSTVDSFVLSVRNWGVEVPSVDLERIFEKFYRVPTTDRWHQGGTGLGLALVRKLALQLGGTIRATSGDGSTTFTLTLPLVAPGQENGELELLSLPERSTESQR